MEDGIIEHQSFICPYCYDDHNNECKTERLKETIDEQKAENKQLRDALKEIKLIILKWEQDLIGHIINIVEKALAE